MIEIGCAFPQQERYQEAAEFAKAVYTHRLRSETRASPDVFAYARGSRGPIGCLGLTLGDVSQKFLFERCRPDHALARLTGSEHVQRTSIGELGTRAIIIPDDCELQSRDISVALTAVLVQVAQHRGVSHLGFVTNRMVKYVLDTLGFDLIVLGEPDFSAETDPFRANMKGFLATKQYCAGFRITSLAGPESFLQDLVRRGVCLPHPIGES